MPRKSQVAPPKLLTPRQLSRWQKARRRQRVVFGIGSLIVIFIAGVLGYGFYSYWLAPRWQPAVRVNESTFNQQYFVNYLRAALGPRSKDAQAVSSVTRAMVEHIQNNELIRQAAIGLNISLSTEEIYQAIREGLVAPDEKDKLTEAEIQRRYQQLLADLKISEAFSREFMSHSLLRKKLQEHLEKQVPAQSEQVKLEAILLDTEQAAKDVHARLEKGEDFTALAKELSKDEGSKEKGGELGWVPRGLVPDLEEAAFSLAPGSYSPPLATSQGYYILRVTERQESRPVAEDILDILKSRALDNWLRQARKQNHLENYLMDKDTGRLHPKRLNWIMGQLK